MTEVRVTYCRIPKYDCFVNVNGSFPTRQREAVIITHVGGAIPRVVVAKLTPTVRERSSD